MKQQTSNPFVLKGLEITDIQSYIDNKGRITHIITAQREGSKIRFSRSYSSDQEADDIVPGMKINLSVVFHDSLELLA